MFVAGWWDGFKVLSSLSAGWISLLLILIVGIVVGFSVASYRRKNSVYGHKVDW